MVVAVCSFFVIAKFCEMTMYYLKYFPKTSLWSNHFQCKDLK